MRWSVGFVAATLLVAASQLSVAQISVDMNQITCGRYLGYGPEERDFVRFWMSGWFSYQTRRTFVDVVRHQQNMANLQSGCQLRPQASVMDALQSAIGPE